MGEFFNNPKIKKISICRESDGKFLAWLEGDFGTYEEDGDKLNRTSIMRKAGTPEKALEELKNALSI